MEYADSMAAKRALFASGVLTEMEQDNRDSIRPRGDVSAFPLSSIQKQLWFTGQMYPDSPVNNISFCYRLYGRLNIPALETAFTEVLRRHEVLRARFTNNKGTPQQSIAPLERVSLPCADLTRTPYESREREGLAISAAFFARPFDLASGQLLRASLFRLASDEHLLAVVVHHIAFDAWSLGIFCQDLAAAYRAAANSAQCVSLSPLPVQYADFAAWQGEWLESDDAANQSAYWSSRLSGAPEPLRLPIDHPRPARQSFRGAEITREIPVSAVVSLTKAARHQNATLYMALYAAFRLLLARQTGQPDILVSTPVAGRSRSPADRLIGCFVNTVTLRTGVNDNLSFSSWLGELKTEILEALANQDLPFDRVLADLRPMRDPSRPTLAQAWFSLQNSLRTELYLPALIATHIPLEAKTSRFDLALDVYPVGGRLRCVFTYNSDLFLPATVERMAEQYEQLVLGVAARPGTILAGIGSRINSKVDRQVPVAATVTTAPSSPVETPTTPFESVLLRIFEDLLDFTPIGVNDSFFDLGGHSLLALRLVARIETETGHTIPAGTLFESPTVRQLAGAIAGVTHQTASSLIRLNREGDKSRGPVFCIHWLNAKPTTFQKIALLLRQDRPIYALQIHEDQDETNTLHSIEDMAAHYIREIRQRRLHGPYHLAGSRLGGLVAFEMARQLLAAGENVGLLLLIDAPMPGRMALLPERSFGALKRWARETLRRFTLGREQTYHPRPYPGKLTLFRCGDAPVRDCEDWRLAWRRLARGGLEIHVVPGDHETMEQEFNVQVLATDFQKCLDDAEREASQGPLHAS